MLNFFTTKDIKKEGKLYLQCITTRNTVHWVFFKISTPPPIYGVNDAPGRSRHEGNWE